MTSHSRYRPVLRALAVGDTDTADRLIAQMDDSEDYSAFVAATFCVVVEHRFSADSSRRAVDSFVSEARANFAEVQPPFKPLAAEAMIRAALDPDQAHLLDEVGIDEQTTTQLALIHKIVNESRELTVGIDDVLDDAEKIVAHWQA